MRALDGGLRHATEAQVRAVQLGTDTGRAGWWAESLRRTVQESATTAAKVVRAGEPSETSWFVRSTAVSLLIGTSHLDTLAALLLGLAEAAVASTAILYAAQQGVLWAGLWRRIPFGRGTATGMLKSSIASSVLPAAVVSIAVTTLICFLAWHAARESGWVHRLFVSDAGVALAPLVCTIVIVIAGARQRAVSRCRRAAATMEADRLCARCGYGLGPHELCSECGTSRSVIPRLIPAIACASALALALAVGAYVVLAYWPLSHSPMGREAAQWRVRLAIPTLGHRDFDRLYVSHRSPSSLRMASGEQLIIRFAPQADAGQLELVVSDSTGNEIVRQPIMQGTRSEARVGGGKLIYIGDNFGPPPSPTAPAWRSSLFLVEPSLRSAHLLTNKNAPKTY